MGSPVYRPLVQLVTAPTATGAAAWVIICCCSRAALTAAGLAARLAEYGGWLMLGTAGTSCAKRDAAMSARDGDASTIFPAGLAAADGWVGAPTSSMAGVVASIMASAGAVFATTVAGAATGLAAASVSFNRRRLPLGIRSNARLAARSTTT